MVKFTTTIAAIAALFAPSGVEGQFLSDWKKYHPIANITNTQEDKPKKEL